MVATASVVGVVRIFFFLYLDRRMEYVDDKQEEMLSGFGPFHPYWIPVIVFSL